MNIVTRAGDLTVSHSSVGADYRGVSSRRTWRSFSFLLVWKSRKSDATRARCARWPKLRRAAGSLYAIVKKIREPFPDWILFLSFFFFFLIIFLRALSTATSRTPAGESIVVWYFSGAASFRRSIPVQTFAVCALSPRVLLTLFHHRWAGRGLGQVDTPNPRTVRNRDWRLTGVRAWKAYFLNLMPCDASIRVTTFWSMNSRQFVWLDIAES